MFIQPIINEIGKLKHDVIIDLFELCNKMKKQNKNTTLSEQF